MAEGRKNSQIRWVATLVVIGLYLAASTELVVSRDLNDQLATRLFALAIFGATLVILLSALGRESAAAHGLRKRWTKRRVVVLLAIGCPLLTGSIWSIISSGTLMGQLAGQTTFIAALLIVGWNPIILQRR
ncbi:hypothetical protein NDR87_08520 [Nocardia sp. CDC159]|uniref:Uncharacterized protein n=1 Tax=Nocardia pulmonis TaxID=2951408 RepID=A0A9X2IVR6_9NOCA|nr:MULTISPECIES: hypothetical protein [Nocardia]MCM6773513.1 hypothetical protein [Nocardia pulmonis]MCM6786400.1 hypothetical protein [Nocardia sp. CDC159]